MIEYLQILEPAGLIQAPGAVVGAQFVLSHAVRDVDWVWSECERRGAEPVCSPTDIAFADVRARIASFRHQTTTIVEIMTFANGTLVRG
jgi:hypothetical protein